MVFLSCTNPFQLRDAEEPDITPIDNSRFFYQLNPDSLIFKMELAFQQKDNQYYEDLFPGLGSDSVLFRFEPVPFFLDRLSNWTLTDEIGYFENLVKSTNIQSLSLSMKKIQEWITVQENPDTLQAQFEYNIELTVSPNLKRNYRGTAFFKIYRGSDSYYRIFYWKDLPLSDTESDSSWSALKAEYRINE
jgi:hypothetical protein